ncbi:solute carrier family 23 protein, partial [uncultured Ruminococcus sp.]|uniref:solute carrier family 23 protein n=1 Tax=uncultured Ruminococcus sp. TaxID=165186 RepID=UPI0025E5BFF7
NMNFSQWFSIKERNTNWSTEILAGVTTFLTMMYIVIVNPTMFAAGGMDFGGVYLATIAAVVIATLIMGIVANYPIAIGPGIGINAYLVYTVMRAGGVAWQSALGAALLASGLFIVLSLTCETFLRTIFTFPEKYGKINMGRAHRDKNRRQNKKGDNQNANEQRTI